jgi:hypothetical protein
MWKVDGSQTREGQVDWKTGPRINLQKAMETRWKPRTRMYSRSLATSPNLCNKKRTLFSTHRALIVAAKAPDDRRLDDSRANLHRDTEEQKMTEYQGFKFCMFAIDMFVPYLMQNSRCQSAPSTAKVHVATRLLLQLAAMIAVHHQPATRSDASFSATPAL